MAWDRTKTVYAGLLDGSAGGGLAPLARASLSALAATYLAGVKARQYLYRTGVLRRERLPGRVVSVGNLTLGGTGKTPMAEWIARWGLERGLKVAVLSRGYGRLAPEPAAGAGASARPLDDEVPTDLEAPGRFWRLADPDRAAAGRRAFSELGVNLVVLDDGFQNLRLCRDLDLVLVDATCPFGNGHLFPRGTLREPAAALARADLVVLTHADLVGEPERSALRGRLADLAGGAPVLAARHRPVALRTVDGTDAGGDGALAGRRVFGWCGIGNPAAFRGMLAGMGATVAGMAAFPDHHRHGPGDLAAVVESARRTGAEAIAITEKDRVKIAALGGPVRGAAGGSAVAAALGPISPAAGAPPILSVVVRMEILDGESRLSERLAGPVAAGVGK